MKKIRNFFRHNFCILYENPKSGVVFPNRIRLPHYYKHFRNSFSRFSTIVEIHRTRGAPLKDYNVDLQKQFFFPSSYASGTLRGILHKNIDEASKKNNFQKKVYQKIFIFRGDRSFSRAKKCNIFPRIRVIFNGKSMEIDFLHFQLPLIFY